MSNARWYPMYPIRLKKGRTIDPCRPATFGKFHHAKLYRLYGTMIPSSDFILATERTVVYPAMQSELAHINKYAYPLPSCFVSLVSPFLSGTLIWQMSSLSLFPSFLSKRQWTVWDEFAQRPFPVSNARPGRATVPCFPEDKPVACVASVSMGFGSKERTRNGFFGVFPVHHFSKLTKTLTSLCTYI